MSLKSWFGLDPDALVLDDTAEPRDRAAAIAKLVARREPQSWRVLLQRVEVSVGSPSADMSERKAVYEAALEHSEDVLPLLHQHLCNARSIAWGLKLFNALRGREALLEEVLLCIEDRAPMEPNAPDSTVQLLGALVSSGDERVARAVLPFVSCPDDDVATQAIRTLFSTQREEFAQHLADVLLGSNSRRVQSAIANGLCQAAWPLPSHLSSSFEGQLDRIPDGPWKIEDSIAAAATGAGFRAMPHFRLVRDKS